MLILFRLMQSKYNKISLQEISSIKRNVLGFYCLPLNTDYLSGLLKKLQVSSTYDTNEEYQT